VALLSRRRFALDTRIATVALAFVVAMVGMPMMSGWVIADSHCAITMDICHPAQTADVGHLPILAPTPQVLSMADLPRDEFLAIDDGYRAGAGRLCDAPDLPPPKVIA